jgi:hypothetical protein
VPFVPCHIHPQGYQRYAPRISMAGTPYVAPWTHHTAARKLIAHTDKMFKIFVGSRQVIVSAERVKPANILEGTQHDITTNTSSPPAQPPQRASHSKNTTDLGSANQTIRSQCPLPGSFKHLSPPLCGGGGVI